MSENNERDIQSYISDAGSRFRRTFLGVVGSSWRATVRFFKYLPWRVRSAFKRKVNEYKNRPPRKDMRKVYVLVGYTTKESVDAKYRAERQMMLLRRGLLFIIMLLLLFISIDRIINITDFGEISHVFGIDSIEEITKNDPFRAQSSAPAEPTEGTKITLVP